MRDAGSRLARAFIQLPFELYAESPAWVPPIRRTVARAISGKHPFYSHSQGEAFVILRGTRVVARYCLLDPRRYNEYTKRRDARLSLPEAIRDDRVWTAMFDHGVQWARERYAERLIGPQGFSPLDGGGILVDGFEHPASMTMMPWHHRWYREQFERYGFQRYKDFVSYRAETGDFLLPEKVRRAAEIALRRGRFVRVVPGSRRELRRLSREIGELYNAAWLDHAEFRPFTPAEIDELATNLGTLIDPALVQAVRSASGELAGFLLPFPDLSRALQRSSGYLGLRTMFDLYRERRRVDHMIINGLGVHPKYRRQGVSAILYAHLADELQRRDVKTLEMTQIAETTDLMLSEAQALTGTEYKRHRVYEYRL